MPERSLLHMRPPAAVRAKANEPTVGQTCPRCFLAMPLTGGCPGCD